MYTKREVIIKMIQQAVKHGQFMLDPKSNGVFVTCCFGSVIGISGHGHVCTALRVYIGECWNVKAVYPVVCDKSLQGCDDLNDLAQKSCLITIHNITRLLSNDALLSEIGSTCVPYPAPNSHKMTNTPTMRKFASAGEAKAFLDIKFQSPALYRYIGPQIGLLKDIQQNTRMNLCATMDNGKCIGCPYRGKSMVRSVGNVLCEDCYKKLRRRKPIIPSRDRMSFDEKNQRKIFFSNI
jgi:hypothetical protein